MSALIKSIQKELKTQDNKFTCDPIYLVQEKERVYGMDLEFAPNTCFYDPENYEEVSEKEYDEAEEKSWEDDFYDNPYQEIGYFDQWLTKMFFFTEKAAQDYVENRSYRHSGELRIYVDSLYNNDEMRELREWILNYEK